MNDSEIRSERARLQKLYKQVHQEWKEYDERYPVEIGAYKPPDYDRMQLTFSERSLSISSQLAAIPTTRAATTVKIVIGILLLALAGSAIWLFLR